MSANKTIFFEDELKQSYLDYAMSVIVNRAIPNAYDGLKPVQLRILYAMMEGGYTYNKPYKKCAAVTGDVLGKYHPHGLEAVYDALVRMAQDFSYSVPLIDGQGNFGSIDGDPAAASRYTECRLAKIAKYLLLDCEKDTVDMIRNYDNSRDIPLYLPVCFPNLLVNGCAGIAVGMTTSIPPHNLGEVIDATCALIDNPELSTRDLMEYIQGPDLPTGGIINRSSGILKMYQEGRGSFIVRGVVAIENNSIIITQIPYQVNKSKLIEQIVDLSQTDEMNDISVVRDESNLEGMRIVIELKKNANPELMCKHLYSKTQLQISMHAYMLALDDGRPKQFSLIELIKTFIKYRDRVVVRRTNYLIKNAKARAHILWGLSLAVSKLDEIISHIRESKSIENARNKLAELVWTKEDISHIIGSLANMIHLDETVCLSEVQVNAILEMRLQSLTGLEIGKLMQELDELNTKIIDLQALLDNRNNRYQLIKQEMMDIKHEFPTPRKTSLEMIDFDESDLSLIEQEDCLITISYRGYIKRVNLEMYRIQKRGGKGKRGVSEADPAQHMFVANTHQEVLLFSDSGLVYSMPAYKIPAASPTTMGRALINLIEIEKNERVAAALAMTSAESDSTLFFVTSSGYVRRNAAGDFHNIRRNGKRAIELNEDESLSSVMLVNPGDEIMITSSDGKSVRFAIEDVRIFTGRKSRGVVGISLTKNERVVSVTLISKGQEDSNILTITEQGFGKRAKTSDYRVTNRGTKGVTTTVINKDTGRVVGAYQVNEADEVLLMNNSGQIIRCGLEDVRIVNRRSKGVHMVKLDDSQKIVHAFVVKDME